MRDVGLETRLDAVGNLFGRWAGSDPDAPLVLTGSHVDTTLNAGRYDGVARRARRDRGRPPPARPPARRRAARSSSSPGRGRSRASGPAASAAAPPPGGSRAPTSTGCATATASAWPPRCAAPASTPTGSPRREIDPATIHALVELHIEQGAVLEEGGEPIGVVTAIAAPHDLRAHAARRRDPRRRDADAPAPRRARRRRRGDDRARAHRPRLGERHDGRHGRRAARPPGRDQRRARARSSSTSTCATPTARRASRSSTAGSPRRARSPRAAGWTLDVDPDRRRRAGRVRPRRRRGGGRGRGARLGCRHRRMTSGAYHDAMVMGCACRSG